MDDASEITTYPQSFSQMGLNRGGTMVIVTVQTRTIVSSDQRSSMDRIERCRGGETIDDIDSVKMESINLLSFGVMVM